MKAEKKSTPRSGGFSLVLVTSGMMEKGEICGGLIKSSADTFCAKGKCTTTSHARKHALFGANRVFLVSYSVSAPNTTRKVIEPEKYHLEVVNPRDPQVLAIIKGGTQDLKGITGLEEAGEIFVRVCDAIASQSEADEDLTATIVEEVSTAWAKEFPESDGDDSISKRHRKLSWLHCLILRVKTKWM